MSEQSSTATKPCAHIYARFRRWPVKRRYRCARCGLVTRKYDGPDRMALRPVHDHMTVAVPGYNTVENGSPCAYCGGSTATCKAAPRACCPDCSNPAHSGS